MVAIFLGSWLSACRTSSEPINQPTSPQTLPPSATISPLNSPATVETVTSLAVTPISPVFTSTPQLPALPAGSAALIAQAQEMLRQLPGFNLSPADIAVVAVESKQWRDSSLGCPRAGMMYKQVITPGYAITLKAAGKQFEFHTNTGNTIVLCLIDGQDAVKVLSP